MKKLMLLSIIIGLCPFFAMGQESRAEQKNARRQQSIATIDALVETSTNTGYTLERHNEKYETGRIHDARKARLRLSVPLWANRQVKISAGAYYSYHHNIFNCNELFQTGQTIDMGNEHHLLGFSANVFYSEQMFGRSVIANANIMSDFSEYGFEKITGFAMAMTPLVQTREKYFGLGIIALINTTSSWPVFPFISYRQTFNDRLSIEIIPPQFYVRYKLPETAGQLSAGMSIDAERFYLHPGIESLPRECLYNRSFFRPEISYEHRLCQGLTMTLKSGVSILMSGHIYSHSGHHKHAKIRQNASCFANLAFSYNLNLHR